MSPLPSVSLCMIVKNEAAWIARAIMSARALVSEVVVVDTGSSDGTVAAAEAAGARVLPFTWCDDFAAARNFSLDHAHGEWALILDADECLDAAGVEALAQWLANPTADLVMLLQTTYSHQSQLVMWQPNQLLMSEAATFPGYIESPLIRLVRRTPDVRFTGHVHEEIVPPPHLQAVRLPVRIHHYGQVRSDPHTEKVALYRRLAERKVAAGPLTAKTCFDYAVASWEAGDVATARTHFLKTLEFLPHHLPSLCALATMEGARGAWSAAATYYTQALAANPRYLGAVLGMIDCCVAQHNSAGAAQYLAQAEQLAPTHPQVLRRKTQATAPTLSLCMIVRNEAAWLRRCLASVEGLVQEIVVVDTGSTDDTKVIAQAAGARVVDFPWCDDFSAARNVSIEHATGDWILVLDADETIARTDHAAIRDLITHPRGQLYFFIQTSYTEESSTFDWIPNHLHVPEAAAYAGYCESFLVRLFCRCPEIRFRGQVHEHAEHLDPSVKAVDTPLRIHHYGKTVGPERDARKGELYLRLGLAKCRERPHDAHVWYELGVQYWLLEQTDRAREALHRAVALNPTYVRPHIALAGIAHAEGNAAEAVRHYTQVLTLDPKHVMPYLYLPGLFLDLHDFQAAEAVIAAGLQYFRDYPSLHINRGVVQMAMGNYRGALSAFREALQLHPNEPLAVLNCGIAWMNLGEWEAARQAFEQAQQWPRTCRTARRHLAEWHFRRRELPQALALLDALVHEGQADAETHYQRSVVLIQQRNMDAARAALAAITTFDGLSAQALERLTYCYRAVGDEAGAQRVSAPERQRRPGAR
ncbi:MAG: glycosyltransferase [Deltaproteobacteria bacterium]|nr:glycosyltransferase [Deltaproteobacteria bacterium]